MSTIPPLPYDVLELIVDLVADGGIENTRDIIAITQTSTLMVLLARKYLFSSLHLRIARHSHQFYEFITQDPDVILHVRELDYWISQPYNDEDFHILEALKSRSSGNLLSIKLSGPQDSDWTLLPKTLQEILQSLLRVPKVANVTLEGFVNFPSSILSSCAGLDNLSLENIHMTPSPVQTGLSHSLSKIPTPTTLHVRERLYYKCLQTLVNEHTINTSQLEHADVSMVSQNDIHTITAIISGTTRLNDLSISCYWDAVSPTALAGMGAALITHGHCTLTEFEFSPLLTQDVDGEPLLGLNVELGIISGRNVLETITLDIGFCSGTPSQGDSDNWVELDSLLTMEGAFPFLKTVSIEIVCYLYGGIAKEEDICGYLSEGDFPRLVTSEAVDFSLCQVFEHIGIPTDN